MKLKIAFLFMVINSIAFSQETNYNTWSIDANVGLTSFNGFTGNGNIYAGLTNQGYENFFPSETSSFGFSPLHISLGLRKNLSTSFSLRLGLSYTNLKNTKETLGKFDSRYLGADFQGYLNINRLTNISIFNNRINFLVHGGIGLANFSLKEDYVQDIYGKENTDYVASGIVGITTQIRISDKINFNLDASNTFYGKHQLTLKGTRMESSGGLIDASVMNLTAGISYNLGKNKNHIDFANDTKVNEKEKDQLKAQDSIINSVKNSTDGNTSKIIELQNVIKSLNSNSDKYDNLNKRINELENHIKNLNSRTKELMDSNDIHVYFDFDSDVPKSNSNKYIETVVDYLKNNPSSTMEVTGYADSVGKSSYNENLSKRRAENVKNLIVKAGIDEKRLSTKWKGSSESLESTEQERALARKVVFRVK